VVGRGHCTRPELWHLPSLAGALGFTNPILQTPHKTDKMNHGGCSSILGLELEDVEQNSQPAKVA
jgi:hypothetical protein